jgi:hypothetical protein
MSGLRRRAIPPRPEGRGLSRKWMSYRQIMKTLSTNPATSDWLRRAIEDLNRRDPIDAAEDIETLSQLTVMRLRELGIHHTSRIVNEEDVISLQRPPITIEPLCDKPAAQGGEG